MNDERIKKELNQIKGRVLIIISIIVIIISIIKLMNDIVSLEYYYVEIYILSISLIVMMLRFTIFVKTYDERIQQSYEKFLGVSFVLMLYGGFAIHFYSASKQLADSLLSINITSTLLLIGSIVFIYMLKKRKLYFNYRWIEKDLNTYKRKIYRNFLVFSIIFLFNILFYVINKSDILIGLITILFSLVSLGVIYLLFSFFEKNNYDESDILESGKKRALTKNASLLLIIPILYSLVNNVVGLIYTKQVVFTGQVSGNENILLARTILDFSRLDIAIMTAISYLSIYFYIKNVNPKLNKILKVILTYVTILLISSLISYISTIISPILAIIVNFDAFIKIMNIISYVSLVSLGLLSALSLLVFLILKANNIKYIVNYFVFAIAPILAFIFNRLSFSYTSLILAILSSIVSIVGIMSLFMFFKSHENTIVEYDKSLLEI